MHRGLSSVFFSDRHVHFATLVSLDLYEIPQVFLSLFFGWPTRLAMARCLGSCLSDSLENGSIKVCSCNDLCIA